MADGGNVTPRIVKAEHIGPDDTGDNIQAKRVANYVVGADGITWQRMKDPSSKIALDTSNNQVDVSNIAGVPTATTADGVQLNSLADEFGDPIGSTKNALNVYAPVTDASGTVANVLPGDYNQNAQIMAGSRKEVPFSAGRAVAVAVTDVSNYRWVSVYVNTQGTTSTVTWQGSNDGVNWLGFLLAATTNTINNGNTTATSTANIMLHGPLYFKYFRLNITGITAGVTAGVVQFFSLPMAMQTVGAAVSGGAATGVAKQANPVQAGFVYNTIQPTLGTPTSATTGLISEAQATQRGGLIVATGVDPFNVAIPPSSQINLETIAGNPIVTSADGVSVFTPADEFGTPLNTTNGALNTYSASPLFITGSNANLAAVQAVGNLTDASTGFSTPSAGEYIFNGTSWDRRRGNEAYTLLASAARTTTQTSADLINYSGLSALDVILDMTVVGTGSVTLTINGKDPASGKYYVILAGAAVITNSTNRYRVGPTLAAAANSIAQDYLPRVFQIVVTANNANCRHLFCRLLAEQVLGVDAYVISSGR
jgi:hypothetical protein